jgi:glucosamine-6-phosphate deaminase
MTMDVRVVAHEGAVALAGAEWVAAAIAAAGRPDATLMPALGTSALGIYRELGRRRVGGTFDTSRLRLVQLDEYEGLDDGDPRLLAAWLRRDVADPLGIRDARVVRLGGDGVPASMACAAYDAEVASAGGIDVAVLGLGPNGHLGFNEPPSGPAARTRSVPLTAASLASNARYWPGLHVPTRALTAGMTTILASQRIVLVVSGERKRAILRQLLVGPVSPALPASYIRTHPAATLLADAAAWPPDLPMPAATDASGVSIAT